jgi:hypothetical protein
LKEGAEGRKSGVVSDASSCSDPSALRSPSSLGQENRRVGLIFYEELESGL